MLSGFTTEQKSVSCMLNYISHVLSSRSLSSSSSSSSSSRDYHCSRTVQPVATCRHSPSPRPASPSAPGRVGMRLLAYFSKRLHGMLSWTHVHVYTRAPLPLSVCCWLADRSVCRPRPARPGSHAQYRKFRATTMPSQPPYKGQTSVTHRRLRSE